MHITDALLTIATIHLVCRVNLFITLLSELYNSLLIGFEHELNYVDFRFYIFFLLHFTHISTRNTTQCSVPTVLINSLRLMIDIGENLLYQTGFKVKDQSTIF